MNKREADTILLACKKHSIKFTMRKEGSVYIVNFSNKIEIKSFEASKLITNGLVVERRFKNEIKESASSKQIYPQINMSKYPKKKTRPDNGISFADRHRGDVV